MTLPIKVYTQFGRPVKFFFNYQITLRDFEQMLIEEDPSLKTGVDFFISDGEKEIGVSDKSAKLLPLLQFENLKMFHAGSRVSYEVKEP